MKTFWDFFHEFYTKMTDHLPVDRRVKYSVHKYRKTYDLLEKYDRSHGDPKQMADPGRLQPYIQKLQKDTRKLG